LGFVLRSAALYVLPSSPPAYDSGGDDGRTYNAADRNTNPKKPTSRAATRHFVVNGKVKPVATIRFTKVSP